MQFSTSSPSLDGISGDPSAINRGLQLAAWQEHKKHCSISGLRPEDLHLIEERGLGAKTNATIEYETSTLPSPRQDEGDVASKPTKAPQAVDIRYVCMCQSNIAVRMNGGHVQVDEGSEELLAAKEAAESGSGNYQGNWSASGSGYQGNTPNGGGYSTETTQGGYR